MPSGKLGTCAKAVQLRPQLLQLLRHRRRRTEVSEDPNVLSHNDKRHDLFPQGVVGQECHIGRKPFLIIS